MENLQFLQYFPKATLEERLIIERVIDDFSDKEIKSFAAVYNAKRKDPQLVLILALLGFLGVAGVHRFVLDQIGLGIVYLLTAGLCGIGTIIDLIYHKRMAMEYNHQLILKTARMIG